MPDYTQTENDHGDETYDMRVWPLFWKAIADGRKRFELTVNDRHYMPGDTLRMYEFVPCRACRGGGLVLSDTPSLVDVPCPECKGQGGQYTGRLLLAEITYVLTRHHGLSKGYTLLSIGEPKVQPGDQHYPI